ncbi:MAG: 50S ribosomal protein L9 [Candidatus Berkelbacteria bacterium]|nr:50S ribosomal protein L9 [Candidatus Berkelbacteria bacterium]
MKIVLTQDVKGYGKKGDEKDAKPGYARNFLLPRGLAVPAESPEAMKMLAAKEESAKMAEVAGGKIHDLLANHQNLKIEISAKSKEGKLATAIKPAEIISKIENIVGQKPENINPNKPLRKVGEYKITADFVGGNQLKVVVEVINKV